MILGDRDSARCGFSPLQRQDRQADLNDPLEPARVRGATIAKKMGLRHGRHHQRRPRRPFPDKGARISWARGIRQVPPPGHRAARFECLTPDFQGQRCRFATVLAERPRRLFNHNVEVVQALPGRRAAARPGSGRCESCATARPMGRGARSSQSRPDGSGFVRPTTRWSARRSRTCAPRASRCSHRRPVPAGGGRPRKHLPVVRIGTPDEFKGAREGAYALGSTHIRGHGPARGAAPTTRTSTSRRMLRASGRSPTPADVFPLSRTTSRTERFPVR